LRYYLIRGAESAVIYENFSPRNIFPQAKFSEKNENFPQRRGRTRVDSARLYLIETFKHIDHFCIRQLLNIKQDFIYLINRNSLKMSLKYKRLKNHIS
jgi:hypothetical protein